MIFIRSDANERIGTGHVMRCLSIAQAFLNKGEEVLFITADHFGEGLINSKGFGSVCLESEWTQIEGELNKLEELIHKHNPSLMLIDSYYVTEEYFQKLSRFVRTAYIDDLNTACWDVDFLINYNIFANVYNYSWYETTRTKLLLNPIYAPL